MGLAFDIALNAFLMKAARGANTPGLGVVDLGRLGGNTDANADWKFVQK